MIKLNFALEQFYSEDNSFKNTLEIRTEECDLATVLLEVVNFLKGSTYSEELIQEYINYDPDNHAVYKIGE